jgi:hypothetical protein
MIYLEGIRQGWTIYKRIFVFAITRPFVVIPFVLAMGTAFYLMNLFIVTYDIYSFTEIELLLTLYLFSVISTFTISIASLFVVELLEQHETTGRMNPFTALIDMLTRDLWRALPFIFIWSIMDFIITLLIGFLRRLRQDKDGNTTRPPGPLELSIKAFEKGLRMGMMLMFTIIGWEDISPMDAYRKGKNVFEYQLSTFLSGIGFSIITGLILVVPSLVVLMIAIPGNIKLMILLFYIPFAWGMGKLIEQLYVSELYLWYYKYMEARKLAKQHGDDVPESLFSFPRPSFTDKVYDLER